VVAFQEFMERELPSRIIPDIENHLRVPLGPHVDLERFEQTIRTTIREIFGEYMPGLVSAGPELEETPRDSQPVGSLASFSIAQHSSYTFDPNNTQLAVAHDFRIPQPSLRVPDPNNYLSPTGFNFGGGDHFSTMGTSEQQQTLHYDANSFTDNDPQLVPELQPFLDGSESAWNGPFFTPPWNNNSGS